MKEYKIESAGLKDLEKIKNLYLRLLKENPGAYTREYYQFIKEDDVYWLEILNNSRAKIFVAETNGDFVGMGIVKVFDQLPGIAVLYELGVLDKYRRKGIASNLIKKREEWAASNGYSRMRTYVISSRDLTLSIFKKHGYDVIKEDKNHATRNNGEGVDVMILEKGL